MALNHNVTKDEIRTNIYKKDANFNFIAYYFNSTETLYYVNLRKTMTEVVIVYSRQALHYSRPII